MASVLSFDSALIQWQSEGNKVWEVAYGISGITAEQGIRLQATDTSASLGGLVENTTYWVYVKDSCLNQSSSKWVGPLAFTTPYAPCEEIDTAFVAINQITDSTAAISLTQPFSIWQLEYEVSGFALGNGINRFVNDSTVLTNLQAQQGYDVYVRDSCESSGAWSSWTGPISFTTTEKPSSIGENKLQHLNMFPNPVKRGERLNIIYHNTPTLIQTIRLYTLNGRLVNTYTINETNKSILINQAAGHYLLEVTDGISRKQMPLVVLE